MFTKKALESKLTPKQAFKLYMLEQCVRTIDSIPGSVYYAATNSMLEGMQNPARVQLLNVDRKIRDLGIEEGLAPINQLYARAMAATNSPYNSDSPKHRREEFKRQFKEFIRDKKLATESLSDAEIDYVYSRINNRSFSFTYFINASKPAFGLPQIPNFRDIFITELAEAFGGNRAVASARLDDFDVTLKAIPIVESVKKGEQAYVDSWVDTNKTKIVTVLARPPFNVSAETLNSEAFQTFFKEVVRVAFVEPDRPKPAARVALVKHILGANQIIFCETPALASARSGVLKVMPTDQRAAVEQLLRGIVAENLESMAARQSSPSK